MPQPTQPLSEYLIRMAAVFGLLLVGALIGILLTKPLPLFPQQRTAPIIGIDDPIDGPADPNGVFCPADIRSCPDGSWVSRRGPDCEFDPCPVAESVDSQSTQQSAPEIAPPEVTKKAPSQSVVIPSSWKKYTATDDGFLFTTSMSLPPGYTFEFSGSEFTIDNADFTDGWDYSTSIFNGKSGLRNFYSGESRRDWYASYLKGDFEEMERGSSYPTKSIISVQENPIGDTSYLRLVVRTTFSDGSKPTDELVYLYSQNGIIHILRPISANFKESDSVIAKNIAAILYSIDSRNNNSNY